MVRRSSARLRNQKSTTPTPLSPSGDETNTATTGTLRSKLSVVQESDEEPGAFPAPTSRSCTPTAQTAPPENLPAHLATPTRSTPIKPAAAEMHPQLYHQTTVKPREEARHLGFSNIAPHTEPPKRSVRTATIQATPTKPLDLSKAVNSPSFQFTFQREHSLELSPQARILMNEKREEASRIREQMILNGDVTQSTDQLLEARKIAKPKGRFTQAHSKAFGRMESIDSRPVASKAGPRTTPASLMQPKATTKTLKRSHSNAGLDQPNSTPSATPSRAVEKSVSWNSSNQYPQSAPTRNDVEADNVETRSATKRIQTKRVKRTESDDVSTTRPPFGEGNKQLPSTPRSTSHPRPRGSNLSHLATPTLASLARTGSMKPAEVSNAARTSSSPAKTASARVYGLQTQSLKSSPALLARSPSKASNLFAPRAKKPTNVPSPSLARSPLKAPFAKKSIELDSGAAATDIKASPLLSRSPARGTIPKTSERSNNDEKPSTIPLLAQSPSKLLSQHIVMNEPSEGDSSKLLGRFNLLRQTPVKSILRSPQRLYSEDPAKIAAGTHFATPPGVTGIGRNKLGVVPFTAPVQKHVDFTSSTKARETKAKVGTPSKTPTPSPKPELAVRSVERTDSVTYPDLSRDIASLSPSPRKRRQTSGPGDFTFRAGEQDIVFGQPAPSPAAPLANHGSSTIRVVSADQHLLGGQINSSKKRKFEFENAVAAKEDTGSISDKENCVTLGDREEDPRPAKRMRQTVSRHIDKRSAATAATPKSAAKRTTLGVKPKGQVTSPAKSPVKLTGGISARLNALAQPKRR